MIKKFFALITAVSLMFILITSIPVFSQPEDSSMPVPEINMVLNSDKSSTMTFTVLIEDEDPASFIDYYAQGLNPDGYEVKLSEDETSMVISKTFPVEDGYLIDLTLYGIGKLEFVAFREFLTTRYGIKNSTFNSEKEQPGDPFLILNIKTPVGASNTNATLVQNGRRNNTWHIVPGSKNEINLTFKTYNVIQLITTIFVLAILILLAYVILTNKKRNANTNLSSPALILDEIENLNLENKQVEALDDIASEPSEDLEYEQTDELADEPTDETAVEPTVEPTDEPAEESADETNDEDEDGKSE